MNISNKKIISESELKNTKKYLKENNILSDIFPDFDKMDVFHLVLDAISASLDFTGIGALPAAGLDVLHGIIYLIEAHGWAEDEKDKETLILSAYITFAFALLPGIQALSPIMKTALKGGKVSIKTAKKLKEGYIFILENLNFLRNKVLKVAQWAVKKGVLSKEKYDLFVVAFKETKEFVEKKFQKQVDDIDYKTGVKVQNQLTKKEIDFLVKNITKTVPEIKMGLSKLNKELGIPSDKVIKSIKKRISGGTTKEEARVMIKNYITKITNKDILEKERFSKLKLLNKNLYNKINDILKPTTSKGKAKEIAKNLNGNLKISKLNFLEYNKSYVSNFTNLFKSSPSRKKYYGMLNTLDTLYKQKNTIVFFLSKSQLRLLGITTKNINWFIELLRLK